MEVTARQLSESNGTDPSKPIDVTTGKSFYGKDEDASRALVKMRTNDDDISPSLDGLTEKEIVVLNDWENNQVHRTSKNFVFSVKVATFCSSVMEDQLNQQLPRQYMQRSKRALENPEAEVEEELLRRDEGFDDDGKLLFATYTTLLGESTYIVDGEGKLKPHPLKQA